MPEPEQRNRAVLARVLVVVIGLVGLPLVLYAAVRAYEAAHDGPWVILVSVLAAVGWVLLRLGVWSLLD